MLVLQDDNLTVDDLWNLLRPFPSYEIRNVKKNILYFSPGQAVVGAFCKWNMWYYYYSRYNLTSYILQTIALDLIGFL